MIAWLSAVVLVSHASANTDSRLAEAARQRDAAAIRMLIGQGADVNGRLPDGATALHWAAHWDDAATAQLLMRAGADVNAANKSWRHAPLARVPERKPRGGQRAPRSRRERERGPQVGETPLMTAARTGNRALVAALAAHAAALEATESTRAQTALMWAVAERHVDVVRELIHCGANVRARSTAGFTPLLFAARGGSLELARMLLGAGADANETAADGSSPLLVATVRGHVDLARFLLDAGANANASGAGYTPLHWAAGSWETELTGPRGILVDRDEEWKALRGLGQRKGEMVQALLAHGADPDARVTKAPPRVGFTVFRLNLAGATPFFLAAMAGDAATMRLLATAGADPSSATKDGTTPLMAAAGVARTLAETRVSEKGSVEAARAAIELGADVAAVNAAGETALHGAAHTARTSSCGCLVDRGAPLNVKNSRGETPLIIAERTVAAGSAPVYRADEHWRPAPKPRRGSGRRTVRQPSVSTGVDGLHEGSKPLVDCCAARVDRNRCGRRTRHPAAR